MYWNCCNSPLGQIILGSDGVAVTGLWFSDQKHFCFDALFGDSPPTTLPVFRECRIWLDRYFFSLPCPPLPALAPAGTPFQKTVWQALLLIPYGTVTTYGQIAAELEKQGLPTSPRAVGNAVGRNPISLMIPCHRVIGAGGTLTGYAGGLDRKRALLELEGALK